MKINFRLCCVLATLVLASGLCAENLLPNASFEQGDDRPIGWRLVGVGGRRVAAAHDGRSAIMAEGRGNEDSSWRAEGIDLRPGSLYRLSFYARLERGARGGGAAIAGSRRVIREFFPSDAWKPFEFIFSVPSHVTNDFIQLGQWHVNGRIFFADAQLLPVQPLHRHGPGGLELGDGESIRDRTYRFNTDFEWLGANYHRPLARSRAGFNSNRWVFDPGAEVVYRFSVAGATQTNGTVHAVLGHYASGSLRVDASRDGKSWSPVATLDGGHRAQTNALPATLFPTEEIFVRMSLAGPNGDLQVDALGYAGNLAENLPDATGETRFVKILQNDGALAVKLDRVRPADTAGAYWFDFSLTNRTRQALELRGAVTPGSAQPQFGPPHSVPPGQPDRLTLPGAFAESGLQTVGLLFEDSSGRTLYAGTTEIQLDFLDDPRPGYLLNGPQGLDVWWCESGWKIGRDHRTLPESNRDKIRPLTVSAARGEYEAAQLILRPGQDGSLFDFKCGPFKNDRGESVPISVTLNEEAFVRVTQPTDVLGAQGWYPDPLPPWRPPLTLRAGLNQPLWITFHIARETGAGELRGELSLDTSFGTVRVPIQLRVYDFALPVETHLKSAFGLDESAIGRYHRLTNRQEKEQVYNDYLRNFAEHRVSPFSFYAYAPLDVQFEGESTNKHVRVDFSRFDEAASRWLDHYNFTTFKLPLRGMGGGRADHRVAGDLAGFKEGTAGHARLLGEYLNQVERHLRERGWLDKAYIFWFDEPRPTDYDFVAEGMKRLKVAAPGVRRMLTTVPRPSLVGTVDIWCGLLHEWVPDRMRERQAAGEEVWWYICTAPKAPFVTEFIDHPGTEMRLWPWQSWQYGVSGILLWNTVYWNSAEAFIAPRTQDPWTDPMSYISGYGFAPGYVGLWGNGDGRFLYPPCHPPESVGDPCLSPPVNSLRWENLRDGMEDYEYFWLLKQGVERAAAAGVNSSLLSEARRLLVVPPEVSRDVTHFTTDPRAMLAHRDRIARMIEQLQRVGNPKR